MLKSKLRSIFSLLLLTLSTSAVALPDYIRKGYSSCKTCHISPGGGGILNLYGRGFSEAISSWSYEGAGSFLFTDKTDVIADPTGLLQNIRADLQADYRRVSVFLEEPVPRQLNYMMESSLKGALHLGKFLDLVIEGGWYGSYDEPEYRVYYAQVRPSRVLSFQVGRYTPHFGLRLDDHTAFTRQPLGFGQGSETFNVGMYFENEFWQTSLTRVIGRDILLKSGDDGVLYESEGDLQRMILRSAVRIHPRLLTGLSLLYDERARSLGSFLLYAPIKDLLYLMAEFDFREEEEIRTETIFTRVGSEPVRGVTIGLDYQSQTVETIKRTRISSFIQWFPFPHFEVRGEARFETVRSYVVMTHFWL